MGMGRSRSQAGAALTASTMVLFCSRIERQSLVFQHGLHTMYAPKLAAPLHRPLALVDPQEKQMRYVNSSWSWLEAALSGNAMSTSQNDVHEVHEVHEMFSRCFGKL